MTVLMVFALPVLLLLLLGTIELGMRVYYRAQVRSAAKAAVLAAVGTQVHWPIPIPTEFVPTPVGPIPVDGFVINTLHLPNVDWEGEVRGEALKAKNLTNDKIVLTKDVSPWELLPSPFKWVTIGASIDPPLVFSKIFKAAPITESACGIAWIRPDYWEHDWWDPKSKQSLLGIGDEDYRYYRLVPCGAVGAAGALEAVITKYVQASSGAKRSPVEKYKGFMPNPKADLPPPRKWGPS